jgi:2-keto-4-pentenoate hydratase/2-oxohepta-3-ene-1,7-dioic acid hydratase (catechol pathway)
MIFATIKYENEQQISCIDKVGNRVFLMKDFFNRDLSDLCVVSNKVKEIPQTMNQLIAGFDEQWIDDMALFFGSNPDLGIGLEDVKLLAPIPDPRRNLICLGKNYADHAKEIKRKTGEPGKVPEAPIYFTKATHTVIGPGEPILAHEDVTEQLDYEVELAVIIGKGGIDIKPEHAEDHIFGYTIANDVSARDLQSGHGGQWFKGKSLTTHCPMGPWIVYKSVLPLPMALDIKSYINQELRQNSNTNQLIFDIPTIISNLSRGFELQPGDIILTGTPAGVGMGFDPPKYMKRSDEVCCMIGEIGAVTNIIK